MTLIEIMVTMTIVGLIFAAAAAGLRSAFNVNLKNTSAHLASTMRYLSSKAVTDHVYLRVVFDLDDRSYKIEGSNEPQVVDPEEGKGQGGSEGKEDKSNFTALESKLLLPVKLPSDVFFKDVSVSYLKQKREKGQVAVYFFPNGFATPALINFRDEKDEDHFSIELFPLSGRVKVQSEYRESLTEETKEPNP